MKTITAQAAVVLILAVGGKKPGIRPGGGFGQTDLWRYCDTEYLLFIQNDQALVREIDEDTNKYFQKRDISLLEFIDQQRIYITTNIQLIELRQTYLNSVNNLNFSIGETVIDY